MSTTTREIESIAAAAARWVARRDAGLSPSEQSAFDRWLASDPRHVSALEHYAKMWSSFDKPRQAGATGAVVQEVKARGKRRQRQRLSAAAGALVVLFGVGLFWQTRTPSSPETIPAANAIVLRPETRHLPDGSIAELKPGAALTVDYQQDVRRIVLENGEAHFQVAKNKDRPFIVLASGVEVRAVGTAFSVQLSSKQVEVLVTEGRVAVDQTRQNELGDPSAVPQGLAANSQTIAMVDAGNRLVVDLEPHSADPLPQPVLAPEINARLAWRAPRVEFTGTPLAEAVALMNSAGNHERESHIHISIDASARALAEEPVSGIFRADNSEAFVRMLELSLGVRADRQDNEIILRKDR